MGEQEVIDWSTAPTAYRDLLMAKVGDRDPVEVLAETPQRVRALTADVSLDRLQQRPEPGEWSAEEILGHLVDDEITFGFRLRLGLTADHPVYPGTEPNRWAALAKPPFPQLLETYLGLREYNLTTIRSLNSDDRQRVGVHEEQGNEPVETTIRKAAGHDLTHIDQLARALQD